MGQYNKTTRLLAAALIAGGVAGTATAVLVSLSLAQTAWLSVLPVAALALLFAWATFIGVGLWRGVPYGTWALVLFASQIPSFSLPGFRYQWFTGAQFGPSLRLGDGSATMEFSANFGADAQFFFGSEISDLTVGVNLFAVLALALLLRFKASLNAGPTNAV